MTTLPLHLPLHPEVLRLRKQAILDAKQSAGWTINQIEMIDGIKGPVVDITQSQSQSQNQNQNEVQIRVRVTTGKIAIIACKALGLNVLKGTTCMDFLQPDELPLARIERSDKKYSLVVTTQGRLIGCRCGEDAGAYWVASSSLSSAVVTWDASKWLSLSSLF